ncbi:hypothetical protein ABW20_dc0104576 [Dactylellina cionopaga]|nr:hypothetical protein ABW20_dc0104576 [Dactylellina cionopaga]
MGPLTKIIIQAYGTDYNLVLKLVKQGYSIQGAIDEVSAMLDKSYEQWNCAIAELPSWGEDIDRQVFRLLEAYRILALGILEWR